MSQSGGAPLTGAAPHERAWLRVRRHGEPEDAHQVMSGALLCRSDASDIAGAAANELTSASSMGAVVSLSRRRESHSASRGAARSVSRRR